MPSNFFAFSFAWFAFGVILSSAAFPHFSSVALLRLPSSALPRFFSSTLLRLASCFSRELPLYAGVFCQALPRHPTVAGEVSGWRHTRTVGQSLRRT